MRHFLVDRLIFLACLAILVKTTKETCPQHPGTDPAGANERIKKFDGQKAYEAVDDDYTYELRICKENKGSVNAVTQVERKPPERSKNLGRWDGAQLKGGNDWLMVTYINGEKYHTHCNYAPRQSILLITCDPDASRGTLKVLEEYKTGMSLKPNVSTPCYYLFELNHEAACSVKPHHMSPGSVLLIIFLIVGSVYLCLGFLYQRFIVGAKGLEQIPNYNLWRGCGSLQADGCNYFCRCNEAQTTRYKTMDDALADDEERDDRLLPM